MAKARIPLVDLEAQYRQIKDEVDSAMARVIERTSFILGEEVERFEQEFAAYCGAAHAIGCGNGTDALELALQGVGVRRSDEVITVSHTFTATAEAIVNVGARPVFVDVRPDTLLMDVGTVEAAITPLTRAVIAVHLYGQTVDMDPLLEVARRRALKVVEDAAQAHGARYKGRRVGSLGDAASFSFYPGKNLGAYGDAGAVVTTQANVAEWVRRARNHGRATKYEHDFVGRNSRMDGIQGAVLRVKLRRLDAWNEARRSLAAQYNERLRSAGIDVVVTGAGCEPVFHLLVARFERRDAVAEKLRVAGIECGIHYPVPLHRQRAYAGVATRPLPHTEKSSSTILSLPIYPELTPDAVREITSLARDVEGRCS